MNGNLSIKLFISVSLLLMSVCANADPYCSQQVLIKNQKGDLQFGAIHDPPKGSDYSVWFPILPRALAFDSQDNIYVGDSVKYRVLKFDKNGKFLLKISIQRPIRTKKPELSHEIRSIAVDKDDNVYVLNLLEYRVEIYSSSGKYLRQIDYFKDEIDDLTSKKPRSKFQPAKVTVDLKGNVYLLGGKDRNKLASSGGKYDSRGILIKKGVALGVNYEEMDMVGASGYAYDVEIYAPDKKLPGLTKIAIKVKDRQGTLVKSCREIDNLAEDENGPAIYLDKVGNMYSFDKKENVIKISTGK